MTWQAIWTRIRGGLAAVRARIDPRLMFRIGAGLGSAGMLLIATEAVIRARIGTPHSRMPSAIYSRPVGWGSEGRSQAPIAIGSINGGILEQRVPVKLAQVPKHVVAAILAVEDQRFFDHSGLDFKRIGGALVANVKAGGISQGGSTITQQLAKNLFLSADRTPLRKLREAAFAAVLEANYDKPVILEAYLNEIYLGQDGPRAIHGVGAASRYYFGKDVGKVSLAEAALLAGMIRAPNRYSPIRHERSARQRRNLVLGLMAEQERITRKAAAQASQARVSTRAWSAVTVDARHFRDLAQAGLVDGVPARGGAVYTTLDPELQRAAERAVREGLTRLRQGDLQAALVALDPRTGDVLALVGGRDYGASQFNRATEARRQPGSAFKPIVALAALHREGNDGPAFTLASRVEDEPLSINTAAGRWEPSNYDGSYRGEVTFREAIEQSLNVPFARIGLAVGPERIVATARRLGVNSPLKAVPSLALGSSEVTLLEMVRAYGVFATGGRLAHTRVLLGRAPVGRRPSGMEAPRPPQVVDPAEAYLVTSALQGVIERGTGRALSVSDRFGSIAGKTGTSNNWRDAWFIAYSPSLVVGAWVGYDDGRSVGLSGAGAALPIVARFLGRADPDDRGESFPIPDGVEFARVGSGDSGWGWDCENREVFLQGTVPDGDCRDEIFPEDDQDREGGLRARFERRAGRAVAELFARLLERAADGRDDDRDRADDGRRGRWSRERDPRR